MPLDPPAAPPVMFTRPNGQRVPLDEAPTKELEKALYVHGVSRPADAWSSALSAEINRRAEAAASLNQPIPYHYAPEAPMTANTSTKSAIKNAFKTAAKLSGARATNRVLARILLDKTGLSTQYPALATPEGRAAFEVLAPILVHLAATNLEMLPKREKVAAATEYAMTAAMEDGMTVVLTSALEKFLPVWEDIVSAMAADAGEDTEPSALREGEPPLRANGHTMHAEHEDAIHAEKV